MITLEVPNAEHGLRQCALTLHAMSLQDREWMLSQLAPERRIELQRLVTELEALGIAPDPQLVRQTMHARQTRAHGPARCPHTAQQLASVLSAEPPSLIAHVLRGHDNAFITAFLACLAPTLRDDVAKHLNSTRSRAPAPAKLAKALREAIDARLPAQPPVPTRRRPLAQRWHSGWRRVRGLLS
ncbi:MAG: hypothetical protein H7255_17805 [Ramlibacter sp.]|nr:hypothetical protein [Ramlibacter sp.]